jgi:hypothetical protein
MQEKQILNRISKAEQRIVDLYKKLTGANTSNYKVYTALLTQSGTDVPVATVLENTLGNVSFSYTQPGLYRANSAGLFISNKTAVFLTSQPVGGGFGVVSGAFISTESAIILATQTSNGGINGNLNRTTIEIRVYN